MKLFKFSEVPPAEYIKRAGAGLHRPRPRHITAAAAASGLFCERGRSAANSFSRDGKTKLHTTQHLVPGQ